MSFASFAKPHALRSVVGFSKRMTLLPLAARFLSTSAQPQTSVPPTRIARRANGPTGKLVNRLLDPTSDRWRALNEESESLPAIHLSKRQICDIELIMNGGFSPIESFMNRAEYDSVCSTMKLPCGSYFGLPVTLDISHEKLEALKRHHSDKVVLRDDEHNALAILTMEEYWNPDKTKEANEVFGGDPEHPAIRHLMNDTEDWYISGKLEGLSYPHHYDYVSLRDTPQQLHDDFEAKGWDQVCAFQTRNPMHIAHFELTLAALKSDPDMKLLIHPVIGMTKPGDIDHHTRVKCYKQIMERYPEGRASLSGYPLAMRMAGPREALWHAIIRKNHGATHFIVGRDHAGPGSNSAGDDFYGPYEARDLVKGLENEIGMGILSFEMMVYVPDHDSYFPINALPEGCEFKKLSGTKVRKLLKDGDPIPEWFSFPNVVKILQQAQPPARAQGVCVVLTGRVGSGKMTVGQALQDRFMEESAKTVTLIDDETPLTKGCVGDHSKDTHNANVERIGYMASEVVRSGGLVVSAATSPYEEGRAYCRSKISPNGGYMLVHLDANQTVCEKRDRRGIYASVRESALGGSVSSKDHLLPYEDPQNPDLRINTETTSVYETVDMIVRKLQENGYVTQ